MHLVNLRKRTSRDKTTWDERKLEKGNQLSGTNLIVSTVMLKFSIGMIIHASSFLNKFDVIQRIFLSTMERLEMNKTDLKKISARY